MGGDEVDAGIRAPVIVFIQIGAPRQSIGYFANPAFVTFPKTADGVAVFTVPLRPAGGKIPNLIPAFTNVPRLGNQLHLREQRILLDHLEKWMQRVESRMIARQRGREIESKSVNMHFQHPIAQTVSYQLQCARMKQIKSVACAGEIEIEARILRTQPVVGGIIDPAEA